MKKKLIAFVFAFVWCGLTTTVIELLGEETLRKHKLKKFSNVSAFGRRSQIRSVSSQSSARKVADQPFSSKLGNKKCRVQILRLYFVAILLHLINDCRFYRHRYSLNNLQFMLFVGKTRYLTVTRAEYISLVKEEVL